MKETLKGTRSFDEFMDCLRNCVDITTWGQGGAKTVEDLWNEVLAGESRIVPKKNGILRMTWPIFLNVLYIDQGTLFEMYEARQIFREDGRERIRDLPGSIGEKGTSKDKPEDVVRKAIKEELDGKIPLSLENSKVRLLRKWTEREIARSYPGLATQSNKVLFELNLMPNQGYPKSFILQESKKYTFFDWRIR